MLELFETDLGRPATSLEEIKEWVYAEDDEQLRFRIKLCSETPRRVA
jgi:hypothetical protein